MALLARQLYFEAVKVGDELPPLVKPPVDRTQIARYAGASGDFNPLHVDEHLARNAGFPSALAPAVLGMGFIAELVVDWLRGARLRRYASRFVKIVWPGDVLTCRGRVVDRRFEGNGVYAIDIEVWAENQKGELVVKGFVTAQLYYSAEDDARQRAGQPPLVVTPQEEEAHLATLSRAQSPRRPEARPPPPPPPRPAPARPATPHAPQRPAAVAASPAARGPHETPRRGAARPGAPARAARRPERPAAKTAARRSAPPRAGAKTRPAPRPPAKAKPAARASRPRPGSKPTGTKRR
jgi:acyl dehydratase